MWSDVLAGVALLLVFEGIMPFVNPVRWRDTIRTITQQPDRALRTIGLISMVAGALLLYVVR